MAASVVAQDLGPFAADVRPPIPLARLSAALGVAAACVAVSRAVVVGSGSDVAGARVWGIGIGVVGIVVSLLAYFRVSTRGLRGRALTLTGLSASSAAVLGSIVYAAHLDGTIRLDRFAGQYLDWELLRIVAPDLVRGGLNTMKAAAASMLFAMALGLLVATFAISRRRLVRLPAAAYVDVVRGTPLIVLAFLVAFGLPSVGLVLGTFAAVVTTLTINASAFIAEIFRAGIQALPRGQMDAARSVGMTHGMAMTSVIIPQAVRVVIPPLMNDFISVVKDTALVYFAIGFTVQTRDMFGAAQNAAASTFSATPFVGAALGYLILTVPLTRVVGILERRSQAGHA